MSVLEVAVETAEQFPECFDDAFAAGCHRGMRRDVSPGVLDLLQGFHVFEVALVELDDLGDGIEIDSFDATTEIDSDDDNIVTYFLGDDADIDGTGTGTIEVNGVEVGF